MENNVLVKELENEKGKERRINLDSYPDIMTTADLSEYLGISKQVALRFLHIPGFPYLKMHNGRRFLIVKSALQEWLHKSASNM